MRRAVRHDPREAHFEGEAMREVAALLRGEDYARISRSTRADRTRETRR